MSTERTRYTAEQIMDRAKVYAASSDTRQMLEQAAADAERQIKLQTYVTERLAELKERRSEEPRGYTRSAYDAQIEELEALVDELNLKEKQNNAP